MRRRDSQERRRPRRSRCSGCGSTHVLLAADCRRRRRDGVEVIGAALVARAAGHGHRRAARELNVHPSTVRGWLRRFRAGAEANRSFFTALAHSLDPCSARWRRHARCWPTRWRPSPPPPGPPSPASVPGRPGPSPRSPALEGCCPTPVAPGRALIERRTSGSSCSSPGGNVSERHRDVALFRYSVMREAADASLTKAERGALGGAVGAGPGPIPGRAAPFTLVDPGRATSRKRDRSTAVVAVMAR